MCEPVLDAAARTIIYSRFRITIEAYLNLGPGVSSDALVNNAVSLLSQPGGALSYVGRGFGDIVVNLRGAMDVCYGPIPKLVHLSPRGSDQTAKITWTVEFHLPTCSDARYRGPMEFNYQTSVSHDRGGLATRAYKGFIRIANGRANQKDRTVRESADGWREKIYPPLLAGFRRVNPPGEFSLSADKCRLDFTITDEELGGENVPPLNVIEAEADHSYSTAQPGRMFDWVGSVSATYDIPKGNGLGLTDAIKAFSSLAEDRLDKLLNGKAGDKPGPAPALRNKDFVATFGSEKPAIIPIAFTVSESSIYGQQRVRLDMKYRVAGASLLQIINHGGLFRAAPGRTGKRGWRR